MKLSPFFTTMAFLVLTKIAVCQSNTFDPNRIIEFTNAFILEEAAIIQTAFNKPVVEFHEAIVIGAGISGLQAATVLKNGNVDVKILEARPRIGGRIVTATMDGAYADLGASWLHNTPANPLAFLANNLGIPLIPTPVTPTDYAIFNNGTKVSQTDINTLFFYSPDLTTSLVNRQYVSCGSLENAINCFVLNTIPSPLIPYAMYSYNFDLAAWFAANTNGISATVAPSYLPLHHDALPSIGYTNFIDEIFDVNSLDIRLNSVVDKIDYTKDYVIINTKDGRTFVTKYLVITVPIGVLKENSIQFVPSLPTNIQTAIQNMGNGLMNKVYMQFDQIFWDNSLAFSLLYTANPLVNYYMIFNFGRYVNKPILLTFSIGEFAALLEKMSDSEIIDSVMNQIRLIYPTAPDPIETIITRWGQDEFSKGAYSYPSLNTTFQDYTNLMTPVQNRLFFAGEAVNININGSADAAYISGENAATQILNIIHSR